MSDKGLELKQYIESQPGAEAGKLAERHWEPAAPVKVSVTSILHDGKGEPHLRTVHYDVVSTWPKCFIDRLGNSLPWWAVLEWEAA